MLVKNLFIVQQVKYLLKFIPVIVLFLLVITQHESISLFRTLRHAVKYVLWATVSNFLSGLVALFPECALIDAVIEMRVFGYCDRKMREPWSLCMEGSSSHSLDLPFTKTRSVEKGFTRANQENHFPHSAFQRYGESSDGSHLGFGQKCYAARPSPPRVIKSVHQWCIVIRPSSAVIFNLFHFVVHWQGA